MLLQSARQEVQVVVLDIVGNEKVLNLFVKVCVSSIWQVTGFSIAHGILFLQCISQILMAKTQAPDSPFFC